MTDPHDFMALARKDAERAEPERRCETCLFWGRMGDYGWGNCWYPTNGASMAVLENYDSRDIPDFKTRDVFYCAGWKPDGKETKDNGQ